MPVTPDPHTAPDLSTAHRLVVMGVSGCGKSSLAQALCHALGATLIEGDDFHSASNKAKMHAGIALTDDDRAGWLATLGEQLVLQPGNSVLSCSALKLAYRERLRQAAPGLRFVFLALTPEQALARVQSRGASHFFHPGLVHSQFEALEPPTDEAGVLTLDATEPLLSLCAATLIWLE